MYRTILVGCDGSEHEADAIALAQQLRDPERGRLILANVFPLDRGLAGPDINGEYPRWSAERAAETIAQAEANVSYGIPCERQVMAGPSAAAGLNDLAETMHADVIVLGGSHHGRAGGLAGRMTVQRLLHSAPCAVAVAAPDQSARFGDSPSVCVAFDASPEADFALEAAYDVARETSASVVLCSVLEPIVYAGGFGGGAVVGFDADRQGAARAKLDDAAARAPDGVAVEQRLLMGTPAHLELSRAAEHADLLVAGSRGYGALHRAIAGSTSGGLLKNGRTPVLVTPRNVLRHAGVAAAAAEVGTGH